MADLAKLQKPKSETITVYLTLNDEPLMNDMPNSKDKPTQMTLTLNSPTSKAAREVEFDISDDMIAEMKKTGKTAEMDARAIYARRLNKIVANTVGWDITKGDIHVVGKPKFSKKAVKDFYEEFPMFMWQAEEAFDKEAGFTMG